MFLSLTEEDQTVMDLLYLQSFVLHYEATTLICFSFLLLFYHLPLF